ncbi:MAG: magnesium chelatase domain-containing protein, partial [bacterium]
MLSKVKSAAILGIDAYEVEVETDITFGIPNFSTVGLPDASVKESKDRVRSAIKNSEYDFPPNKKITINLSPADRKKEGPSFDLPIAAGILAAEGFISKECLSKYMIIGELSLDGSVKRVKGALSMAIRARQEGYAGILVPPENAQEAAVAEGLPVYPVRTLTEAITFLETKDSITPYSVDLSSLFNRSRNYGIDFRDVKG